MISGVGPPPKSLARGCFSLEDALKKNNSSAHHAVCRLIFREGEISAGHLKYGCWHLMQTDNPHTHTRAQAHMKYKSKKRGS